MFFCLDDALIPARLIEEEHPEWRSAHKCDRQPSVWLLSAFLKQIDILHPGVLVLMTGPCGGWWTLSFQAEPTILGPMLQP